MSPDKITMLESLNNCKNCLTALTGEYCHVCRQKKFVMHDLKPKKFAKEASGEIFDFNSKIFITLKFLVIKPGKLTVDYLEGIQKRYIGPVKMYLMVIALT